MKRLLLPLVLVVFVVPAAVGAQPATGHAVDLASGRVDGHAVLGRTIAGVTAALGRPDFRVGPESRYRIGWGNRSNFSIEVIFRRSGNVQRAWSIVLERGPVRDVKIGDLLNRSSPSLQTAIVSRYGDAYKLERPPTPAAPSVASESRPTNRRSSAPDLWHASRTRDLADGLADSLT
jgi:hypothetical protein